MLKNFSRLEIQIDDKVIHLSCDIDTNLAQLKEALFQFQKYIGQFEDRVREEQEKAKQEVSEEKIENIG